MKTTAVDIGEPSPRQFCFNAGLLAFARTATNLAVADTIDDALTGQQNPNLTHTVGSTMTSLALALILGADDVSDINLLDLLVPTGLNCPRGRRIPRSTDATKNSLTSATTYAHR